MIIREILGRYIIGKGIVPFLRFLIEQLKRLERFMFNQQMDIYYHYQDRQDTEFLNHIRTQINYGKEN
jgi:hypothetical protein|tara:strand:+ start:269 stop:472 length:204 start_codon:yes stop_codon:yes gene_type:complete